MDAMGYLIHASKNLDFSRQAIPENAQVAHLQDAMTDLIHAVQILAEHSTAPREIQKSERPIW